MKRIIPLFLLFALALNGCAGAVGTTPLVPTLAVATLVPVDKSTVALYGREVARPLIKDFMNMGPRVAGSEVESQTAQYIVSVFKGLGYNPITQPFTADAGTKSITSANVVAIKTGNSAQEIIVGAHYDSSAAGPGADDNASGVAVMLEVAKLLQNATTPYTLRFVAFGAGDSGLLGSYAFLNQMSQQEFENTIAMIDLDSLLAGDIAYVFSDEDQQSVVRDWALEWALGNGLDLQTIKKVDFPGSGSTDRRWEQPVMDATGRLIVYVTFTSASGGGTSQILVP